ncbi:unnamed protein product [Ectocarpus sp. 12 AP-2014]
MSSTIEPFPLSGMFLNCGPYLYIRSGGQTHRYIRPTLYGPSLSSQERLHCDRTTLVAMAPTEGA